MIDAALARLSFRRSPVVARALPPVPARFGVRSGAQVARDLREVLSGALGGGRFQAGPSSAALLRPDLSLAAYAGYVPEDGLAPVFNLFDRVGGGRRYTQRVTRDSLRDFRGGRLSYDEHDGTDLVCPVGTPLVAAAPGVVVMVRDRWLRGGLTVALDHGHGVLTQYTHCSASVAPLGAVLRRGDTVALSGAAGFDMVQFFPLVPPHIHFLVSSQGTPVDPFLARGEGPRTATWIDQENPSPSGPRREDEGEGRAPSAVTPEALARAEGACRDARIRAELAACGGVAERVAALLEDALTHDAWAWPTDFHARTLRPAPDDRAPHVRLSLPLPGAAYRGVRFADAPWTAP